VGAVGRANDADPGATLRGGIAAVGGGKATDADRGRNAVPAAPTRNASGPRVGGAPRLARRESGWLAGAEVAWSSAGLVLSAGVLMSPEREQDAW